VTPYTSEGSAVAIIRADNRILFAPLPSKLRKNFFFSEMLVPVTELHDVTGHNNTKSHFSTAVLFEQLTWTNAPIAFALLRQIRYGTAKKKTIHKQSVIGSKYGLTLPV